MYPTKRNYILFFLITCNVCILGELYKQLLTEDFLTKILFDQLGMCQLEMTKLSIMVNVQEMILYDH